MGVGRDTVEWRKTLYRLEVLPAALAMAVLHLPGLEKVVLI